MDMYIYFSFTLQQNSLCKQKMYKTQGLIEVPFIIAKRWKKTQISTNGCINKMWHIHIMEYDLVIKINELIHGTTLMNLKIIKLHEEDYTFTYYMIPFNELSIIGKSIKQKD